jgi:sirohydrochlorin cobaltochelatase
MNHLILAAFGTTTRARMTYDLMNAAIAPAFSDCHIHWTYTSPTVRRQLAANQSSTPNSLSLLLEELNRNHANRIVIQSLHVTPGHEFHRLVRLAATSSVPTAMGMPLLTTPDDYQRLAHCLLPLINSRSESGVLILGHGTSHPTWTAYPALENVLRSLSSDRVFVAALEKYPDSSTLVDRLAASGYQHVLIIPCLMVAGMHFKRDIVGDGDSSWKKRLERGGMSVTFHEQGLGMLPGVSDIFCNHIRAAFDSLNNHSSLSTPTP